MVLEESSPSPSLQLPAHSDHVITSAMFAILANRLGIHPGRLEPSIRGCTFVPPVAALYRADISNLSSLATRVFSSRTCVRTFTCVRSCSQDGLYSTEPATSCFRLFVFFMIGGSMFRSDFEPPWCLWIIIRQMSRLLGWLPSDLEANFKGSRLPVLLFIV